jgi:hypothetical protein
MIQLGLALRVLGTLVAISTTFFILLFALDNGGPLQRNRVRSSDAKRLQSALEAYKVRHGGYPAFPDNPVGDLKALVAEGFLNVIPEDDPDIAKSGFHYRYASGGSVYGILFIVEPVHWPAGNGYGGLCLQASEGARGSGMWGDPPPCGF